MFFRVGTIRLGDEFSIFAEVFHPFRKDGDGNTTDDDFFSSCGFIIIVFMISITRVWLRVWWDWVIVVFWFIDDNRLSIKIWVLE